MFCPSCGQEAPEPANFCQYCGHPLKGTAPEPSGPEPKIVLPAPVAYAGFWLRFVAILIDGMVVSVVVVGAEAVAHYLFGMRVGLDQSYRAIMQMGALFGKKFLIGTIIQWLYWAGLESSVYQATLGKMALGLKVTDMQGEPISFARASGRYFGKIISALLLGIGFLMAGWTEKKQALHDFMAGTLVVRKQVTDETA